MGLPRISAGAVVQAPYDTRAGSRAGSLQNQPVLADTRARDVSTANVMISLHSTHSSHTPAPNRPPPVARETAQEPRKLSVAAVDPAEQRRLRELAARDNQVRTHERAHLAAAGGLAHGGARFQLTRGPDGRQYATGGEVSIDVSPVAGDPQATIEKAQTIRRAALAPAEPSQADRAVAARATAMANEARIEMQREARETDPADESGVCPNCGGRHGPDDAAAGAVSAANGYAERPAQVPSAVDTSV